MSLGRIAMAPVDTEHRFFSGLDFEGAEVTEQELIEALVEAVRAGE